MHVNICKTTDCWQLCNLAAYLPIQCLLQRVLAACRGANYLKQSDAQRHFQKFIEQSLLIEIN